MVGGSRVERELSCWPMFFGVASPLSAFEIWAVTKHAPLLLLVFLFLIRFSKRPPDFLAQL